MFMDPGARGVHLGDALCNKDLPECRDYFNMAIGSFVGSAEPWDANSNPLPESLRRMGVFGAGGHL